MSTPVAPLHAVSPFNDTRWNDLVARHDSSSVFHSVCWLEALRRTYEYEPIVVTTSPPGEPLQNGLVFCRIRSWLTGRRWVSLPFSDHCAPLMENSDVSDRFLAALDTTLTRERLRYIEFRPLTQLNALQLPSGSSIQPGLTYWLHRIDLTPDLATLFHNCHKDSIQRKIRRAQREQLDYQDGRSAELLEQFYRLLVLTRRRHGLPPQPRKWFRNLADCFGDALKIRVAAKNGRPIASILTLRHKDTLVYKYGCSDAAFNNLGGTHLLFWKSIEEAKHDNLRTFDLGRSDLNNHGLITFKDRWGGIRSLLHYATLSTASSRHLSPSASGRKWKERLSAHVFSRLPTTALSCTGSMLYKHIG